MYSKFMPGLLPTIDFQLSKAAKSKLGVAGFVEKIRQRYLKTNDDADVDGLDANGDADAAPADDDGLEANDDADAAPADDDGLEASDDGAPADGYVEHGHEESAATGARENIVEGEKVVASPVGSHGSKKGAKVRQNSVRTQALTHLSTTRMKNEYDQIMVNKKGDDLYKVKCLVAGCSWESSNLVRDSAVRCGPRHVLEKHPLLIKEKPCPKKSVKRKAKKAVVVTKAVKAAQPGLSANAADGIWTRRHMELFYDMVATKGLPFNIVTHEFFKAVGFPHTDQTAFAKHMAMSTEALAAAYKTDNSDRWVSIGLDGGKVSHGVEAFKGMACGALYVRPNGSSNVLFLGVAPCGEIKEDRSAEALSKDPVLLSKIDLARNRDHENRPLVLIDERTQQRPPAINAIGGDCAIHQQKLAELLCRRYKALRFKDICHGIGTMNRHFLFDDDGKSSWHNADMKAAIVLVRRLISEGCVNCRLINTRFTGHYDAIMHCSAMAGKLVGAGKITGDDTKLLARAASIAQKEKTLILRVERSGVTIVQAMSYAMPSVKSHYERCLQLSTDHKTAAPVVEFLNVFATNIASPALLVACALLPTARSPDWSLPVKIVVMESLMEAARVLQIVPSTQEDAQPESLPGDSPFKKKVSETQDAKKRYVCTEQEFLGEIRQLLLGKIQLQFLDRVKDSKNDITMENALEKYSEFLRQQGLPGCARLLDRARCVPAGTPWVEAMFAAIATY